MSSPQIGAHVSAAGGAHKALERVAAIGGNALQLFSGSPRSWARKDLGELDIDKFTSKKQELAIDPVITHSLYLINLASDKKELREKSVAMLRYDLGFDSAIGGSGIVVHLGSHLGKGWEAVREIVAEEIAAVLKGTPENSTFLIENSAGQKGKLCSELAEIRWLLDEVKSPRLGWCIDTCHAHAAGYWLGENSTYPTDLKEIGRAETLVSELKKLKLWDTLKCIHVNDSKDPFGAGRDRHQNITDGEIDAGGLKYFLKQAVERDIPLITEVPGMDKQGPDAENIERIKQLLK